MDGKPQKLFIRLDDGSLIGRAVDLGVEHAAHEYVRISVQQAAQLGRVSNKEPQRLEAILARLRQQYQLPTVIHPAAATPGTAPPSKKPKLETAPSLQPSGTPGGNWIAKCQEVLKELLKHLGIHQGVFYNPADAKLLPDYYLVVKQPLFLVDIDNRLRSHQYQSPQDFLNDMKHHFNNVRLYNPEGDPYRKIGNKAEEFFDQLWAGTGFSLERTRRNNAGQAANKFDPEQFEPPSKPRPTRSQPGANGRARSGPRDHNMQGSHEVTSGKHGLEAPTRPSQERIQQMGAYLSSEDLPEDQSNYLLSLLPQSVLTGLESGEIELDFEALDDATLCRIDDWLRNIIPPTQHNNAFTAPVAQPSVQPSVRVDSYTDEDYEEEESEESD